MELNYIVTFAVPFYPKSYCRESFHCIAIWTFADFYWLTLTLTIKGQGWGGNRESLTMSMFELTHRCCCTHCKCSTSVLQLTCIVFTIASLISLTLTLFPCIYQENHPCFKLTYWRCTNSECSALVPGPICMHCIQHSWLDELNFDFVSMLVSRKVSTFLHGHITLNLRLHSSSVIVTDL